MPQPKPIPAIETVLIERIEAATEGRFPVLELLSFGPTSDHGTDGKFKTINEEELGFELTAAGIINVFRLQAEPPPP